MDILPVLVQIKFMDSSPGRRVRVPDISPAKGTMEIVIHLLWEMQYFP